ncbi:BCCT family transporter [Muricauda sp. JGD-17]|uniref:BCCT family transporter n=1 Tax=Flagellimonas ochracea TaxID=2696472 RepID=A0A964TDL5_9FLAO|nr:BCCT family transporter [Allomuricauda ochracea]NAY92959.1 BCCT family transporter [Allomuricauda ochracea]
MFQFLKNNKLLSVSTGLLVLFSAVVFLFTQWSYQSIESLSLWVRNYFGYFYLYLGLGCVLLLLGIAISPWGTCKLGNPEEKPEHSTWAWASMLYSTGMGAGILLRAVQEPVFMQQNPPFPSNSAPEILALEFTFYQWGFTAWAFYGIFALVIGHALFIKKQKVLVSSAVPQKFKGRKRANAIDILAILTTVFGLIAAVGLGTAQITGGLNHAFNSNFGVVITLLLAVLISTIAFISVWMGVDKGIKQISKFNIAVTLLLLAFVFVNSNMGQILLSFGKASLQYLIDFIPMSLAVGKYNPGIAFLTDWTFYYWAFWLAWAPFTGIFIARISRGRTLRQMLLGVLILPSLGTFFWFSIFGTSAFEIIATWGSYNGEFADVFSSIFVFLSAYPLSGLLNGVTILLLVSFLVTSVDSAVFVLSMFTDKGNPNPDRKHRLIWSVLILFTTLALILLGYAKSDIDVLVAVQKLLIVTSLPFAFFMVFMVAVFLTGFGKGKG